MDPTSIGLSDEIIVLGKHSGRHALQDTLEKLGYRLTGDQLRVAFKHFKAIADRKGAVSAMDLESLLDDELRNSGNEFVLESFKVSSSTSAPSAGGEDMLVSSAEATVDLVRLADDKDDIAEDRVVQGQGQGDGPVDAVFAAINEATGVSAVLKSFTVSAVTEGQDALGEAAVVVVVDGAEGAGQAVSTDIVEAAAQAYLRAIEVAARKTA
jgi:2-isopropylmalate synthase